jgi:ATP-dependent DNA ligase
VFVIPVPIAPMAPTLVRPPFHRDGWVYEEKVDGWRAWMKVKVRHEGVFVVGGIRDVNAFDGVLVGERVGDALHYRGVVEWGFRGPDVLALLDHARRWSRPAPPFVDLRRARSVTWVEPRLEAEVSYAELVEGRLLRAPSWRGLCCDDRYQMRPGVTPSASREARAAPAGLRDAPPLAIAIFRFTRNMASADASRP